MLWLSVAPWQQRGLGRRAVRRPNGIRLAFSLACIYIGSNAAIGLKSDQVQSLGQERLSRQSFPEEGLPILG